MEEIASTKRFFLSQNITLSDDWLGSCIEWYRDENPNLNYTHQTLHSAVYAQWLLLDLRDVKISVLPPNVAQQKKIVLNGTYCLQMLHILDIAHPKFVQIQKIRNSNVLADLSVNNQEQNVGSKRMLQMLLTDGVQEVEAIEYKHVKVLNPNLKPGTKIKITGPITVRRGQMMLENKHVHLLDGEVEELLVVNAYENILARALRLPENPNPSFVEETVVPVNVNVGTQNLLDQYVVRPHTNSNSRNTNKLTPANVGPIEFDEALINDEIDMLLEAERDVAAVEGKWEDYDSIGVQQRPSTSYERMDVDDELFLEAERNATILNDLTTHKEAPTSDSKESLFGDMDLDAHLDMIDNQVSLHNNKIVPIISLLENRSNITVGQFTIKAKFKKVVEKLSVRDTEWLVKILVGDDTGDMEVRVATDVVSSLIGYDPVAVIAFRKSVLDKDKNTTASLMKGIEVLKEKLTKINGELVITFTSKEEVPSLLKIV